MGFSESKDDIINIGSSCTFNHCIALGSASAETLRVSLCLSNLHSSGNRLIFRFTSSRAQRSQIRSFPFASVALMRFIRPYHNRSPTAMAAVAKEHAAHTKFPVGYPLSASPAFQIHCAMICETPAKELFMAVAMAMVAILGTLQVTQALSGPELGNGPHAQRNNIQYREV